MYVCMSVTGLRLKYMDLHTLCTCLARDTHDAIAMEVASRSRTQRKEDNARTNTGI